MTDATPNLAGQVGLIPGASGWVTYLICRITGSHCGHTILITGPNECVSADPDGVHVRPLTDFGNYVPTKFPMTDDQRAQIVAYAKAQAGKPYSFADDALIGLERIFGFRFPNWVRARFASDHQFQCAQLCDASLKAGGVEAFDDGRMTGDVFPGSFEELCIERGWYTAAFFAKYPVKWS